MNQRARVYGPNQDTGAAPSEIVRGPDYTVDDQVVTHRAAHGPIRWGPIWAGLFTAFTSFVLIELFLFWIGALSVRTGFVYGATGTGTAGYVTPGSGNAWITAIVAIVTFFLGGWAAGSSKVLRGTGSGLLSGYLVWALATTLIIIMSAAGLGSIFGAAGNVFNNMVNAAHQPTISGNVQDYVGMVRDGAGWAFLFMVLSAIAAALGGWLGNHDRPYGVATTTGTTTTPGVTTTTSTTTPV